MTTEEELELFEKMMRRRPSGLTKAGTASPESAGQPGSHGLQTRKRAVWEVATALTPKPSDGTPACMGDAV